MKDIEDNCFPASRWPNQRRERDNTDFCVSAMDES